MSFVRRPDESEQSFKFRDIIRFALLLLFFLLLPFLFLFISMYELSVIVHDIFAVVVVVVVFIFCFTRHSGSTIRFFLCVAAPTTPTTLIEYFFPSFVGRFFTYSH